MDKDLGVAATVRGSMFERFRSLGFPTRAANCAANEGCETLADVARLTDAELLRWPNMGRKTIAEIRKVCDAHGFQRPMLTSGLAAIAAPRLNLLELCIQHCLSEAACLSIKSGRTITIEFSDSAPCGKLFALLQDLMCAAQGIEAATADETRSGSAVGESPVPEGDAPNPDPEAA